MQKIAIIESLKLIKKKWKIEKNIHYKALNYKTVLWGILDMEIIGFMCLMRSKEQKYSWKN